MTPIDRRKKKPVTALTNLDVNEVSVVDRGANQYAKIALRKRDEQQETEMSKTLTKEKVLKLFDLAADHIAERDGIPRPVAYTKALQEHGDWYRLYESLPSEVAKAEEPMRQATISQALLEAKAVEIAKRDGTSFDKAFFKVMNSPEGTALYRKYEEEYAAGKLLPFPTVESEMGPPGA